MDTSAFSPGPAGAEADHRAANYLGLIAALPVLTAGLLPRKTRLPMETVPTLLRETRARIEAAGLVFASEGIGVTYRLGLAATALRARQRAISVSCHLEDCHA